MSHIVKRKVSRVLSRAERYVEKDWFQGSQTETCLRLMARQLPTFWKLTPTYFGDGDYEPDEGYEEMDFIG